MRDLIDKLNQINRSEQLISEAEDDQIHQIEYIHKNFPLAVQQFKSTNFNDGKPSISTLYGKKSNDKLLPLPARGIDAEFVIGLMLDTIRRNFDELPKPGDNPGENVEYDQWDLEYAYVVLERAIEWITLYRNKRLTNEQIRYFDSGAGSWQESMQDNFKNYNSELYDLVNDL